MSAGRDEAETFLYLCIGFVFGIIAFFRGFTIRKKKKLIENIPTSTIRGMAMGLVEIQGVAHPFKENLQSPFSKAACVFYHYKIEEHQGSGRSSRWVTIKEYASPDWFYLQDGTGEVLVNPAGAEFFLRPDRNYRMGSLMGGTEAQVFEEGLIYLGISPQGFLGFSRELRCTETYIAPGDEVYVMGTASKNPMVQFSEKGSENLCIRKEDGFFCISDKSEKELLNDMDWKMILFLYGGPVLTVACLFLMIQLYFQDSGFFRNLFF